MNIIQRSVREINHSVPTSIIANDDVIIEQRAIDQVRQIADLNDRLPAGASIDRIVATPDLHPGSPFPVGVVMQTSGIVIPGAAGYDIGCGMRLAGLDVSPDELDGRYDLLSEHLRHQFFAGGRDLPLSPRQREALLREGLYGLLDTYADNADHGLWRLLGSDDLQAQLPHHHLDGSMIADTVHVGHERWVQSSGSMHGRDDQIGSLGGGNHFAELQVIEHLHDPHTARTFGLKQGNLAMMIHSGSVSLGSSVGAHWRDKARALRLAQHIDVPEHLAWLELEQGGEGYIDALKTMANFATANRLAMMLMFQRAMELTLDREVSVQLVWDCPHNFTWPVSDGQILHRKGATPAIGPTGTGTFAFTGEPVLLPGSMGDASWVMAGRGNDELLSSASHGAGRAISRGKAAHADDPGQPLRVVLPADLDKLRAQGRSDIANELQKRLNEERPAAYKPVLPALQSLEEASVARRVAKLKPLLTVKGA